MVRLHPPAKSVFGIATKDFVLESQCGFFKVRKEDLLNGDIYWTQRNEKIFPNPNMFQMDRFYQNPELLKYIFAFGPPDAPDSFHACIGKHLTMKILRLSFAHLLHCDIILGRRVKWSGNNFFRVPASDKPVTVKRFVYVGTRGEGVRGDGGWEAGEGFGSGDNRAQLDMEQYGEEEEDCSNPFQI